MLKKMWIVAGVLALAAAGCDMDHREHCGMKDKEKEENEVKVPFEQTPAAVQATLQKESDGAAIKDVDKETDDGKTIYEADAMIGGKNYEIKVAEDGTLVKKSLDKEEDEKGEKGEKGEEKEEKGEH
jgi:uncharacterized membrane protein YkoI